MKTKRKPNTLKTLPFSTLRRLLEESGFEIVQTTESRLLAEAKKQTVKARSLSPQICGLIVPDSNQILVNRSLPHTEKITTVLHELIHLADPDRTEAQTEAAALDLSQQLSERDRGYIEFLLT